MLALDGLTIYDIVAGGGSAASREATNVVLF